jgi:hypothetical protein
MATKIKIDRAAFPLLRRVPAKNIAYNHSYSSADGTFPCDMTTAVAENSVPNWINAEGMAVLVSTSNSVWTVSPTVLRIEYNTNESTSIPPPTDSTRYISGWKLRATSADGGGWVEVGYSAMQRAVALNSVEALCSFQKAVSIDHMNTYANLNAFYDPTTGEPLYTRYAMTYYHCTWTVEVWEKTDNDEWIMHTEPRDNYITASGNNWFAHAVPLDKQAFWGAKSHDVISETEVST